MSSTRPRSFVACFYVAVMAVVAAGPCRAEPTDPRTLVGQVLLPPGEGSRGVEVVVTIADAGGEASRTWLLFDEQGRFAHDFEGELIRVTVSTGIRAVLHRIGAEEIPGADPAGRIDVGAIDLRERLARHRLRLRAAEGARQGEVRIAMCFGPPPVGPEGEPIALGSRQFPPIELGSEVEWLLPHDAQAVHFLVERPLGASQRLFGPFDSATLPAELIVD